MTWDAWQDYNAPQKTTPQEWRYVMHDVFGPTWEKQLVPTDELLQRAAASGSAAQASRTRLRSKTSVPRDVDQKEADGTADECDVEDGAGSAQEGKKRSRRPRALPPKPVRDLRTSLRSANNAQVSLQSIADLIEDHGAPQLFPWNALKKCAEEGLDDVRLALIHGRSAEQGFNKKHLFAALAPEQPAKSEAGANAKKTISESKRKSCQDRAAVLFPHQEATRRVCQRSEWGGALTGEHKLAVAAERAKVKREITQGKIDVQAEIAKNAAKKRKMRPEPGQGSSKKL